MVTATLIKFDYYYFNAIPNFAFNNNNTNNLKYNPLN